MGVPVAVTIDSDVLAEAESLGLDVPHMLEGEIRRRREAQLKAQVFYEENREAIDSYNAYIEKHGTVGSRYERHRR